MSLIGWERRRTSIELQGDINGAVGADYRSKGPLFTVSGKAVPWKREEKAACIRIFLRARGHSSIG